jgi:DNA primase
MTGHIPHSFIETLLSRVEINEIIGARLELRRMGGNFVARCPFHNEKTPSFSVNVSKQLYHCFGCGASGNAIRFLMEHDGLHFVEAIEVLANQAGLTVPEELGFQETQNTGEANLYTLLSAAEKFYQVQLRKHPAAEKAKTYLKSRGLSGEIAKQFKLGFASPAWDGLLRALGTDQKKIADLCRIGLLIQKEGGGYYDRFRNRVLFPIRDRRGRVVGFGGRLIEAGEPKYLNSPETSLFHKSKQLYGLYEARMGNPNLANLIVVEGYMDVISLAQFEIKNVVATLGTALTDKHVDILFKQASELIFCFDGDKAGQTAAQRALPLILPKMKEGRRVRFLVLPEKEDPDSLIRKQGKENFLKLLEKAKPLSDFLFDNLTKKIDVSHLDGRAELVALAKPLIQLLPTGVFQQMLYERLAELAGISLSTLLNPNRPDRKTLASPVRTLSTKARPLPPSLSFRALAFLLEYRELLEEVGELAEIKVLQMSGIPLLCAIIEILRSEPDLSIEKLQEKLPPNYREELDIEALKILSRSLPSTGVSKEFIAIFRRLRQQGVEQVLDSLLGKAKNGELSDSEKERLKELLLQKEQNRVD